MTYKAVFTDEFLSYFRLDDNGKTLVLTDKAGLTRAVTLEEVKHGEWIKGKEIAREMLAGQILHIDYENFTCSNCGLVLKELLYHIDGSPFYKFCPNCGADMREGKESKK
ncbi:MAG: hypothetical protein J5662_07165 [Clostridia bacterium]|nr:hypothetical protein [Clostridia bacterium]